MVYVLLLLIGFVSGLRVVTPLAAIALGTAFGWIDLAGTWAGFVENTIVVVVLCAGALVEFYTDQLPWLPSRKTPMQFTTRIVLGAVTGTLLGLALGSSVPGLVLGAIGAVLGTLGGYEGRKWLAGRFGRDLPAAIIEDIIGVIIAVAVVYAA